MIVVPSKGKYLFKRSEFQLHETAKHSDDAGTFLATAVKLASRLAPALYRYNRHLEGASARPEINKPVVKHG